MWRLVRVIGSIFLMSLLLVCSFGCAPKQKVAKSTGVESSTPKEQGRAIVVDKVGFVPFSTKIEDPGYYVVARTTNNEASYGAIDSSITATLYGTSGAVIGSATYHMATMYPKHQGWLVTPNTLGKGAGTPSRAEVKVNVGSWKKMSPDDAPKIDVVQKQYLPAGYGSSKITGVFRYSNHQGNRDVLVSGLLLNTNGDAILVGDTVVNGVGTSDQPFEIQLNDEASSVADIALTFVPQ